MIAAWLGGWVQGAARDCRSRRWAALFLGLNALPSDPRSSSSTSLAAAAKTCRLSSKECESVCVWRLFCLVSHWKSQFYTKQKSRSANVREAWVLKP